MLEEARQYTTGPLPDSVVISLFDALNTAEEKHQLKILRYLCDHIEQVPGRYYVKYFPRLLHMLKQSALVQPLVQLLLEMCSVETVTVPRIRLVSDLYEDESLSDLAELLRAMRHVASASVYVSTTGQQTPLDAKLPPRAVYGLAAGSASTNASINTRLSLELQTRHSDIGLAKVLASIASTMVCSGTVPLAVEEFAYVYLRDHWQGDKTLTLLMLAQMLRWWPHSEQGHALLMKLLEKADGEAAVALIDELIYYEPSSEELVRHLAPRAAAVNPLVVLQYYQLRSLSPSPDLLTFIICAAPAGLVLCEPWGALVADVARTLQGMFSLRQADILTELVPEIDYRFALANSPWLGNLGRQTLASMSGGEAVDAERLASVERAERAASENDEPPALISHETLPRGITYDAVCQAMLDTLNEWDIYLDNYW